MKAFILSLITCSFLLFSVPASADKITITGEPITVMEQEGVYVPSTTVMTDRDYYYFNVNDSRRVCYKEVRPSLANVDAGLFRVKLGDEVVSLHCYTYEPEYFVVQ